MSRPTVHLVVSEEIGIEDFNEVRQPTKVITKKKDTKKVQKLGKIFELNVLKFSGSKIGITDTKSAVKRGINVWKLTSVSVHVNLAPR
jgi:hypothetical protein